MRSNENGNAIADGDDGPFIPAMAAAAVIGHVLDGRRPARAPAPPIWNSQTTKYNLRAGAFSLA
jgi:hypothetical protein